LLGHNKSIRAFACLPEQNTLVSIDHTPSMILWDMKKGMFLKEVPFPEDVDLKMPFDVVGTDEGKSVWVSAVGGVYVFDSTSFEITKKLPYREVFVMLAVGSTVWCGMDGKIVVFDVKTFELVGEISNLGAMISTMNLVGENTVWASGVAKRNNKGEIYVINTKSRSVEKTVASQIRRVNCMVTAKIASVPCVWIGCDEGIAVWDSVEQKRKTLLETSGQPIQSMCSFADQVWAGSKDRNIYVYSRESCKCVGELTGCHTDYVLCMTAYKRPGSQVYDVWTGSADRAICVWTASKINENV